MEPYLISKQALQEIQENAAHNLLASLDAWERVPAAHKQDTPKRFVKALKEITTREPFNFTVFPNTGADKIDELVTVGPIPFYTLCAHHVLPFFGHAYIGYVPGSNIAGLSKFARAVQWCAKGLWVQESLTQEIATFLEGELDPEGIAVVLKAEHLCMAMRGIEVANATTTTSAMRGVFADHSRTAKAEFLEFIK